MYKFSTKFISKEEYSNFLLYLRGISGITVSPYLDQLELDLVLFVSNSGVLSGISTDKMTEYVSKQLGRRTEVSDFELLIDEAKIAYDFTHI